MKTKGTKSFSVRRLGAVAAVAFALVATTLPSSFAAGEVFGKKCNTEGISTGQSSTSLICTMGTNGKLTWTRVRLGSSNARPVAASSAPDGTIEFHHIRTEDKAVFQTIIDKFQAANP